MKKRLIWGLLAGAVALTATVGVGPAMAADGDAQLSVIHGIPGTPVDVWVNGTDTVKNFQPGTMAGPLSLAPGSYTVAITKVGAASPDNPIIGPITLPLAGGGNYSAVAHLTVDGKPTATLFTNDTSATAAGQGRLTVRHVAAAPAVDVVVGDKAVISALTNPNEKVLNLPAGNLSASVTAAGTTEPVLIGPADVAVKDGTNTIVYAYGSASDKTLALVVQTIDGLGTPPAGVQAGTTGAAYRAEQSQGGLAVNVLIGTLAVVLLAVGIGVGVTRRRKVGSPER